jgi:cysteine desulfurase/selenocysteine lyase
MPPPMLEITQPSRPDVGLDPERLREDFPILSRRVHGKPLVYLDSAATSQRPRAVLEAMDRHEVSANANVHRGVHELSRLASEAFEGVRHRAATFLNAARAEEIIFTSGTTASINLVAQTFGRAFLRPGDEIVLTEMEHHSNVVPWQLIRDATGSVLRVAPITEDGSLDLAAFRRLLSARTRLVAVAHASNVLGTVNPIRAIADLAHDAGAVLLVDGAQAVAHLPVDVQALDCDFFAFSGHKMLGPTGVGILYGRLPMLERMPPWQGGGGMIASVTFETTTYAPVPAKFEAGTPPITQAIGLGAAIEYLGRVDLGRIGAYEQALLQYATRRLQEVPGIRILGTAPEKVSVLSFVMDGVHPHDLGTVLDAEGIAIRAGHHCAQPLMRRLGVAATARASFAFYNTRDEVDRLVAGLLTAREVFG